MNHASRYTHARLVLFLISLLIISTSVSAQKSSSFTLKSGTEQVIPSLEFRLVPRYGDTNGVLYGQVFNIDPTQNRITTYIRVNNGWWIKPTAANPTVPINYDDSWSCDITTGGIDQLATEIDSFAIPNDYSPPVITGQSTLPDEIFANAVAYVQTTRSPNDRIFGLNYGPYRAGQEPGGSLPSIQQIAEDMALLAQKVQVIRIYSSQGISQYVISLAGNYGIQVVLQAWIGSDTVNNQFEIDEAIRLANAYANVIAVFVGSEVLMRNDVDEATLIGYIQQVRRAISVPVGYADDDYRWLNHPNLINEVDWVGLDLYGFWNCKSVAASVEYVQNQWQNVRNNAGFAGKRILVAETGWPNAGYNSACQQPILGTTATQAQFVEALVSLSQSEGMDLLLFEATDELWKCNSEPIVGCHWGLLNKDRNPWQAWNKLPDIWPIRLIVPRDDTTIYSASPTLSWSTAPHATKYNIQIDNNSNFSSPIINTNVNQTSFTLAINLANDLYYWRVQAQWGNWSSTSSFTVYVTPPNAAPERNYYTTQTPTLCWNLLSWATEYELQVDENNSFISPLEYSITVSSDTLCATTSDLAEGKHYWRVRAKQGDLDGMWSTVDNFFIYIP